MPPLATAYMRELTEGAGVAEARNLPFRSYCCALPQKCSAEQLEAAFRALYKAAFGSEPSCANAADVSYNWLGCKASCRLPTPPPSVLHLGPPARPYSCRSILFSHLSLSFQADIPHLPCPPALLLMTFPFRRSWPSSLVPRRKQRGLL